MGDPKEKQIRQYYIEQGYEGQALDDAVNYAIEYQAKQTKQTEPKKQTVEPPVAKGGNKKVVEFTDADFEKQAAPIKPPELVNKDLPDIKERELFYTKGLQQKGFKGEDLQKRLDFALNRDRDRYNKKLEAYEKQVKDSQPKPKPVGSFNKWWNNDDETDDSWITSLAKNAWNNAFIPLINNLGSIPEVATNFIKTGYNLEREMSNIAEGSKMRYEGPPGIAALRLINDGIEKALPYVKPLTDAWEKGVAFVGKGWNDVFTPLTENFEFNINPDAMNPAIKPAKGYTEETFSILDMDSWEVESFGKWAGSVGQGIGSTGSIFLAAGAAKLFSKGKVSPALAAFMAGSLTETNGIMQNLMENHDMSREEAMAIAAFAGPIIGTVDVLFGIENIAAKGFFREIVEDEILKTLKGYAGKKLVASQFQEIGKAIGRGVTKRITPKLLNSAVQMGVESVTEGGQSGIEKGIYQLVDNYLGYEKKTGERLFDKVMSGDSLTGFELNAKAYVDMINEAAIGGIASGPFTAIHMAITPSEQQTLFNYIESQVRSGKDPRGRLAGLIDDQRSELDDTEKAYARDNVQEMYNVAEAFKGVKGTADGKFQMYSLAKEKIHLQNKINEFQAREQELAGRISELEELTNNPPTPPTPEEAATYQAQNAAAVAELAQRQAEYEQHIAKADDVKQYSENISLIDDTAKKVAKAGTVDITYETNKKALEEKYKKATPEPADSAATPAEEKVKKKSKPAWKDGRKEGYMRSRMADLTDENGKRKAHIKDDDGDWFAVIRKPGTIGGLGYDLVEDAPTIKALNDIFGEETVVPVETPVTVAPEPIVTPPPAGTEETPVAPTAEPIVTPTPAEPAKPKTKYNKLKDVVLAEGETHAITFLDEEGESTDKSITVKQKLGNQYRVEDETGKEFLVQADDLQNDIFEQDQSGVSADFSVKYTPTKPKPAQGKKEETQPKEETPAPTPKEETKAPAAEKTKDDEKTIENIPLDTNITLDEFDGLGIFNSSVFGQLIYKAILNVANQFDIKIKFSNSTSELSEGAAAHFDSVSGTVLINLQNLYESYQNTLNNKGRAKGTMLGVKGITSFSDFINYTITHELIHGVTQAAYVDVFTNTRKGKYSGKLSSVQVDAIKAIGGIFNYLKSLDSQQYFGGIEYGLHNMSELMAEMSNEGFVSALQRIELPENLRYNSKSKNVFESIISFVRDFFAGKKVENNAAQSLYSAISDIITSPQTQNFTESNSEPTEQTQEEKIRTKIAEKKARLKKLNDERNTLKIADDPKRNAEMDIEMLSVATEMIGDYIELGKIKFKDIVNDIIAEDGRTFAEQLFNYIKKAYAAYYTSATDDIADQMDDPKSVRGSKFEDFAEITEPDVVDKAEPIKEQPKQVNTNSGIEKVLNKLRGKVDEQVGNAKTTLSEFEAKALEQEISKLEEKAVSEGGASFNEAEPQNFNYEKIDGKEQKINVYEADGYKIEYGYSRQGWISITTPSGEVLRIIDKKYKNERGRDVVYYAQLKDETRPKTEKPKTVKSAIPTVGEKNEDGEYAYNAPFHEAVDNNTGDVIVGTKEYNMPLADGDTIQYTHVVADAALILPSHDPSGHVGIGATGTGENGNLNVSSLDLTEGYPERDGKSANSREYNTKSVIEAMFEHAYDLITEFLLGSPTSSNGEPVITDDGVVISGNSRTMSLWVAIERNKDKKTKVKIKGALRGVDGNYDRYLAALKEEIAGSPAKYAGITVEQIDDMVARGKHPILVKKSSNIKEYSKTEFDRYNQDLTQSKTEEERAKTAKDAIDSATPEQKQQLADLFYMVDDNGITSSIKDILSSKNRAQKIADLLSGMGLLSKADYAKYLHNGIFNNAGIEHVASVLRGIVLSDETLEIFLDSTVNDEFGLKHFVKNIERALPALLYNYLIEGDANVVDWLIAAVQLKTYHYNQGKTDDGYLSVPKKRGVEQKDNIDGFIDMRIRETQTFPTGDANDVFFGLMENEANRLFVTAFFAAANAATRAFASTDLTKLVQAFNNEHRRSVGEKILEETANIFSDTNEDIVRKDALNAIETLVATYYPQLLLSKIADPNISEQEKAELQKQADIHNKKIIANIYDNLIKQGLSIAALEKFARDTFGGKSSSGTTEPIGTKEQKDSKGQETTDTGNAGDTDAGTNQSGSESENKSTENDQATGNQGREPKSGVGVGETEVAGTDSTEQTDTNAETGATENQEKPAEIDEQTTPPTHRVSEEKAVADNKKARAYNGDTLNGVLYSFEEEMRVAAASNEAVKKEKLKAKTSLGVVEISYDKTKDRLAYKKEDGTPLTPNEIETLFVEIVQGKSALTDDSGTTVFAPKETVSNNEAQAQYRAEVRDALKKDKGVSKDIADDTISVESVYKMADQAGVMPADLHKNIKQAILDKTGYTAETYSEILKKPTDGQEKKTDSSKQELRDESKPSSGGAVRGNPSRRVHSERPPIVYAAPNQIPAPEEQIKDNEYTYLDEHQRFGVNLILTRFFNKARGFFLADGPGVGKTAILLAVAHVMSKKGKVLIVTQSKDIINDSFKDDAIGLGIDPKKSGITITTYNDIKTLDEGGNMKFSNTEFVLVIYDESHKLKNSHTGNAIASFNIKSDHILFSSATPMDKPTGAVYFMSQILGLSEEDIYNRLGLQVSTYRDKDGVSKKKVTLLKGTSPQQVAKRLQGLALTAIREGAMLRREFPFWGTVEEVALIPDNIAEILAEEAEIKSYWEGRPRTAGQMLNELRRWNESKKVEAIWQLVMEELAAGRKVVVFANFYTQSLIKGLGKEVPMFITLFTEKAEKMGIPIAKLWSAHDVTIEREKFQNGEVSIALGTFGSAATGVQADDRFGNEPRTLILVTPPYAGDLMQQAIGRVSRKLSQSAAKAIVVYVPGTSDSHAMGIMKKKIMTLEAMQKAGAELEALSVADDFLSEVEGTEPEAGSTELVKDAAKINDLNTKQLDEDNFLVYGTGTYHNRHAIKTLGGRFNGNHKGWVFPLSQRAQIERELGIKEEAKFQIAPERGRSYSPVSGSGRGKESDVEAMAKRKAKEGETVAAMKPEEREKYMVKRKAKVLKMAAFLNKVFPKIKLRIVSKAEFYAKFKAEIDAGRVKLDNIGGVKLGDEVWLNIDAMVTNELTAVHEFAHVFTAIMKEYMNKTYMKGLALVAGTVYHQYALATHSGVYKTPEDYLEEALVLAIEDMGGQILSRTLYIRFVDWARSILNRIGRRVGFVKGLSLADMSLNDFTRLIAERMLSGSEISLKEDVSDEIYAQMQIFGEPIEAPDIVAKRSGGILSNPRFSYIGAANIFSNKSKEVIKNAYKMALSMMANGKTSEEIRVATGWFRNPYDKKWRYEIGDREMSFKNDEESLLKISQATEANPLKLSDVINHDKLFALFPELKDIYIIYKQGDTTYHASMRSDGNRITVALPFFSVTTGQQLAILLHEVQHSIQIREGLAMGASPEQMTDILANLVSARAKALQPLLRHTEYPLAFVRIGEYYNALKEILGNKEAEAIFEKTYRTTVQAEINSIEDKINGYDSAGIVDYQGRSAREYLGKKGQFYSVETRRAVNNRLKYADVFMDNENLNRKYRLVSTGAPLSSIRDMYYMATAGEIEARDVEARMFMTDKQRQDTPPYSTEDYQSDEAITYFGTDEDADFAEDLVGFRPQIIPALKDVESTAKALEDSVLKEDQMALAVTAMQKGGTINYKDIKKSTTSSNYETYINRPDLLDDKSKKIYNELYAGGKLRNKKILLDNNGKLIDGTHRFKALLAMGQTDFDYAVPSDNFFTQPYTRTISEAYHKAKKDGSNPELVKAVEDLLGTQDPPKFSITPTEIKAQAIANGTFMKAPNGKPTNLNERQWLQVRTPEFKAWFGDWESDPKNASKVVDANGEPLVVYHGTSETFNEFNTKRGSSGLGGIYFTPKKEKTAIHGENVMSVFLNLRNPLDISKKSMFLPFEGQIEIDKKNGNDGYVNIRPHEEEYIAFEPNQIKSATDNTGTFSPDTNDIRFSITPTTTPAGTSTARFSIPNGVEISEYLGQQERNAYHGTLSTMNHASIIAQMRTDLDDYVQAYITNNIGSATKMKMLANFYDDPIMLEVAQTITDPFFTPSKEAADLYKFIFDSDPDTPSQNLFGAINKYRLEENYSFLGVHEKIDHAADVTDVANQQQALNDAKSGVTKFILNRRKFLIAGQKFGKYLQQQMIDLFNFTTVSKWFSTATGTLAKFDQLIKDRNLIAGKLKARNNQLFELAVNEFSHMTAYRGVNNYTSVKKIEVLNARDGKLYKMPVDYVISLIQMHESFVDHWARQGKNKVSPLIDSTSSGETDGFVFQDFDDPTIQRILRLDDAEYLRLQDEINNTPEYSAMYHRVETLFNRNDIFDYLSQTYSHNTGLKLPRVAKYFPLTAITDTNAEMDLRNITGLLEETSIIKPRTGPARQYRLMGAMSAMKAHYETVEDFVQNQEVILNISNYLNKNEKVLKADKYNQPELIEYLTNFMKDLNNWRRQVYEQNKDQQKVINIPKMLSKFALSRFAWNFGMPLIQAFGYFPALMQGVVKDKYLLLAGKDLSYLITRAYTDSLLLAGEKEKLPILPLSTGEAKLMDEIRHNVFASELYLRLHQTNPDVDLTPLTEINPRSASTIAGAAMQSWNWLINTVADKYGMSFMRRGDRAPILTFYKAAQYQFDAESVGGMLDGMNRDKWVADKATKLMYLTNQLYPMNQRTGFQRRKDILSKMVGLFSGQQQKQLNLALQSYADYLVTPTTENKWRLTGAIGFGIIFSAFGTAFVHALFKGLRDSIKPGDDDDDDEKQGEMLFDYFRTDLIRNLTGNVPGIPTELFNTFITYIDKQYWTDKPADIPPLSSLTELMEGLGEMHNGMTMDADGSIKSEYEQAKSIHRGLVMINRNAAQLLGIPFEFARQFENTVLYSIKPEKPKAKSKKAF